MSRLATCDHCKTNVPLPRTGGLPDGWLTISGWPRGEWDYCSPACVASHYVRHTVEATARQTTDAVLDARD